MPREITVLIFSIFDRNRINLNSLVIAIINAPNKASLKLNFLEKNNKRQNLFILSIYKII